MSLNNVTASISLHTDLILALLMLSKYFLLLLVKSIQMLIIVWKSFFSHIWSPLNIAENNDTNKMFLENCPLCFS